MLLYRNAARVATHQHEQIGDSVSRALLACNDAWLSVQVIGSYTTELDAARAHDCAAMHMRGPQANFPNLRYPDEVSSASEAVSSTSPQTALHNWSSSSGESLHPHDPEVGTLHTSRARSAMQAAHRGTLQSW